MGFGIELMSVGDCCSREDDLTSPRDCNSTERHAPIAMRSVVHHCIPNHDECARSCSEVEHQAKFYGSCFLSAILLR
jgi:hypothetical protein